MAEKYDWSMLITKKLIIEYENNEMLFNTRHHDYKKRNKRLEVYRRINTNLNAVQSGLDIKELKRKISGLRSQYLIEKLKVTRSKESGADAESIYKPTVYWYPLLKFLDVTTEADLSHSNLDEDFIQHEFTQAALILDDVDSVENSDLQQSKRPQNKRKISEDSADTALLESSDTRQFENAKKRNNAKRLRSESDGYDSLLAKATVTMNEMSKLATAPIEAPFDDFDIFGKFVANELREMKTLGFDQIAHRRAKSQIQRVLVNMWDTFDYTTRASTSLSNSTNFVDEDSSAFDSMIIEEVHYE